MAAEGTWHGKLLTCLSDALGRRDEVKAALLGGSLADDAAPVDAWSDVDLTVVATDAEVLRLFGDMDWLRACGKILGLERHDKGDVKLLRLCFAPCRRADISLVPETALARGAEQRSCSTPPHRVLWSRLPELDPRSPLLLAKPSAPEAPDSGIAGMADAFWFRASVAIARAMRNDLLVGLHLALDLARDCLVLRMIRRDREKGTNVHRFGGFGNDITGQLVPSGLGASPSDILALIGRCARVFDELARDVSRTYEPRAELMAPALAQAEAACQREAQDKGAGASRA